MIAKTQIGGKYDKSDSSVFELKRTMQESGIEVTHPMSDSIISTVDGRGYTFDPTKITFLDVETDYYDSIANSDFHTVNNRFGENLGYIGGSASLEMAYAMVKRKPILLMHPPTYSTSAEPEVINLLTERQDQLYIHDLSSMQSEDIQSIVESIKDHEVDYNLSDVLGQMVLDRVDVLFENIRSNPL